MQRPCKGHKATNGSCLPFRPFSHTDTTANYRLAKFLVPVLKSLTSNNILSIELWNNMGMDYGYDEILFEESIDIHTSLFFEK